MKIKVTLLVSLFSLGLLWAPWEYLTATITSPDTNGNFSGFGNISLKLDATGNPVVSYLDDIMANFNLKVLHCSDDDCSSGEVHSITTPTSAGSNPSHTSLQLDGNGFPVVSFLVGSAWDLGILHCGNSDCSAGNSINSPDTGGDVGSDSSLVLNDVGNPAVSYHDEANGDLKILRCDDPNCDGVGESTESPHMTGFVGKYTSLALNGDLPVVSYSESPSGALYILTCDDPNCSGDESGNISTPDALAGITFTSLALDANANPVVAYYDAINSDLKILRCGNPDCTAGNTVTNPDTDGVLEDVGQYPSLVLDELGYPVVSYYDATNGDLKIMHCNDPNCLQQDESITSPDMGGDVGQHTSLDIDDVGNPVVAYVDTTNLDLKLLHCTNSNCGPDLFVTAADPAANAVGVALDANVDTTLNLVLGSVIEDEYPIFLGYRGRVSCVGSIDAIPMTVSCDPTVNFLPGERVRATITRGVRSYASGVVSTAIPYTRTFVAAATTANDLQAETIINDANFNEVRSVVLFDLENDGDLDLAATNRGDDTFSLFINNNGLSFASTFSTGINPEKIVAGDFNSDGFIDLAVLNYNNGGVASISHYLNNQAGGFAPAIPNTTTGQAAWNLLVTDIEPDGDLDIVVSHASDGLTLFINNGAAFPIFTRSENYQGEALNLGSMFDLDIADLNNDGIEDLIVADNSGGNIVTLINGIRTAIPLPDVYRVRAGDLDGDGDADLVATNGSDSNINTFTNNNGLLSPSGVLVADDLAAGIHLADMDGDARLDIFTISPTGIQWNPSNGGPKDNVAVTGLMNVDLITTGDVNGDGILDIVAPGGISNSISTLLGLALAPPQATTVQFTSSADAQYENSAAAAITLTLDTPAPIGGVTVDYVISGTATPAIDFTIATTGTITIPQGDSVISTALGIVNDTLNEDYETMVTTISNPQNATLGANTQLTFTIVDDDPVPTVAFTENSGNVNELNGSDSATLELSAASSFTVTIPFTVTGTADNGNDYTLGSGSPLTIPAGELNVDLSLTSIDDELVEVPETIIITLENPTNATLGGNAVFTFTLSSEDTSNDTKGGRSVRRVRQNTDGSAKPTILKNQGRSTPEQTSEGSTPEASHGREVRLQAKHPSAEVPSSRNPSLPTQGGAIPSEDEILKVFERALPPQRSEQQNVLEQIQAIFERYFTNHSFR